MFQVLLPAFSRFGDRDYDEFVDTDTGRELSRVNGEMSRTLVQASLLVGDSPIAKAVLDVRAMDLHFPEKAMGAALSNGSDPFPAVSR
jgi:hypothetical protein